MRDGRGRDPRKRAARAHVLCNRDVDLTGVYSRTTPATRRLRSDLVQIHGIAIAIIRTCLRCRVDLNGGRCRPICQRYRASREVPQGRRPTRVGLQEDRFACADARLEEDDLVLGVLVERLVPDIYPVGSVESRNLRRQRRVDTDAQHQRNSISQVCAYSVSPSYSKPRMRV